MADEPTTPETAAAPAAPAAADAATPAPSTDATPAPASAIAQPAPAAPVTASEAKGAIADAPATAEGAAEVQAAIDAAPEDARAMLEKYAAQCGFVIKDGEVSTRERVQWRDKVARQKEQFERSVQEREAQIQQREAEHMEKLNRAQALLTALEANDLDAFAKHAGHTDWNAIQEMRIKQLADPNYKELQELKRKQEEYERREQERANEWRRQEQLREEGEKRRRYLNSLSQRMSQSQDPLLASMADDPPFVQMIAKIQEEQFDPETRTTVSPEKAVEIAQRGTSRPPREELRALYQRLHKVYGSKGDPSPAAPAAAVPAEPKEPKPSKAPGKTQVVKGSPVEASPPVDFANEREFMEYARRKMEEAAKAEAAEKKRAI